MFDENRLNWPPNGDINAWADYVETLCILTLDGVMSIEDFADRLLDDPTKTFTDVFSAINFNENFLAPLHLTPVPSLPPAFAGEISDIPDEELDDSEEDEGFDGDDEENEEKERVRSRLITLFNFLKARQEYFADFYPFDISDIDLTVRLIPVAEHTNRQKLYQVLLFSSEMHLYSHADINRLGHLFEALCKRPFSQLVPAIAEKRFFGAGAGDILPADYLGNLHTRLGLLAADLVCNTKPIIEDPDEIGASGDAGLDWVGWVSFEDNCNRQPIYFGQCACGANWVDKQHETSLSHWFNYLDINQSIQCFHFMPRSFRRSSLTWFRETKIIYHLTLIDRYRMLKMFSLESDATTTEMLHPYADILQNAYDFVLE